MTWRQDNCRHSPLISADGRDLRGRLSMSDDRDRGLHLILDELDSLRS